MKVLQTIYDLGTKSGGLASSTYNLAEALYSVGVDITVGFLSPKKDDVLCGDKKVWMHEIDNDALFGTLAYSRNMHRFLDNSNFDIYHTNGNWGLHNYYTVSTAKKKKKPYIISTHGNFYPQALSISHWKKALAGFAWVNGDLNHAAAVCATSEQEMRYLREYGVTAPIAVIPNVILIPEYISEIKKSVHGINRKFCFLGRLHPIKNIDKIIYAWEKCSDLTKNASLFICGSGDVEYENFLKNECERLKLTNVYFKGWVDKREKYELLADMSVLLSPSKQENFGMSIAEALLMRTPALASLNTPWPELERCHCGWWIEDSIDSIASVISDAISMNEDDLIEMGNRGHDLIMKNYTMNSIGKKMAQLYKWVMDPNSNEIPEFVFVKK